jgi:dGTPase
MSDVVAASVTAYGRTDNSIQLAHTDSHAFAAPGPWKGPLREQREESESLLMAPGATRARGAGQRAIEEEPDARRTCFERDLDRIKYSHPFRRLVGKCQVFLAPDDVHIRNRMTHALEVAQVATTVARSIGLNVALTEAIALAHDCGHGPGGHSSEDAFAAFVPGGYDHAIWGADVTLKHLNLCAETLDGVRSHSWRLKAPSTPEGEVVSIADRAYLAHDFDDAVRSGILAANDIPSIVLERCGDRQSAQIGSLISSMVTAVEETGQVGLTSDYAEALCVFREFNYERIYLRPESLVQSDRVIAMLSGLVEFYTGAPGHIPAVAQHEIEFPRAGSTDATLAAVSYVSGMTDRFAMSRAQALLNWRDSDMPRGV